MIGEMVRAAQQDCEAVACGILCEVCFGNGSVFLKPVRGRKFCKAGVQLCVHFVPAFLYFFRGGNVGHCPVRLGEERGIEFGAEPGSEIEQRKHGVMNGSQVPPQINQAVFPRGDFFGKLFGRESGEQFIGSFDIRFPGS